MESANGQSTGLGGVGWGADALSEAPGHLAKPTSPFLCRSLLSSTLAPGTRPPSPPSDSHPPGGCQLTPLLSDWGAFKAQLDPAIPPTHTCTHCVHLLHFKSRAPSTPNWCTVGLKLFPGPGLGDLLSEVPDSWEGSVPSRCPALGPATGRGGVRPAPPARGRPSSGAARSASFRVGCSLFSVGWGPVVSGSGAHEALVWAPAGWMAPRSGREAALGPEVRPLLSAWGRGSGEDSSATPPPGRLEDPGQENEVG